MDLKRFAYENFSIVNNKCFVLTSMHFSHYWNVDVTSSDCKFKLKETERWVDSQQHEGRISLLNEAWGALLTKKEPEESEFLQRFGISKSSVPNAPHLENCKLSAQVNKRLDTRAGAGRFPPWTTWKGSLDMYPATAADENIRSFKRQAASDGAYPPWVCS